MHYFMAKAYFCLNRHTVFSLAHLKIVNFILKKPNKSNRGKMRVHLKSLAFSAFILQLLLLMVTEE